MGLDLTQDAMTSATAVVEMFNRRDFNAMVDLADGRIDYTEVFSGRRVTDPDEFRAAMQGWADAFPNLAGTVTAAARDGDLLAYEVRWEGIHDGPLQLPTGGVVPASGRSVTSLNAYFVRFDGDRVAEVRNYGDVLSLLAQVGAMPTQGAAPGAAVPVPPA